MIWICGFRSLQIQLFADSDQRFSYNSGDLQITNVYKVCWKWGKYAYNNNMIENFEAHCRSGASMSWICNDLDPQIQIIADLNQSFWSAKTCRCRFRSSCGWSVLTLSWPHSQHPIAFRSYCSMSFILACSATFSCMLLLTVLLVTLLFLVLIVFPYI